jgi:hypothetical protein
MEWFFWCKRHQKGDLEAAEVLARDYAQKLLPRATPDDRQEMGIFYALTDKPREALECFRKAMEAANNPYDCLHVAVLAMALKDAELRDTALLRVIEKGDAWHAAKGTKGVEVELAREFRNLLELGAGAAPEPGTFSKILARSPDAPATANGAYFVGRFLEFQCSPAHAKEYYQQAVKTGAIQKWNYLLAREALKKKF